MTKAKGAVVEKCKAEGIPQKGGGGEGNQGGGEDAEDFRNMVAGRE